MEFSAYKCVIIPIVEKRKRSRRFYSFCFFFVCSFLFSFLCHMAAGQCSTVRWLEQAAQVEILIMVGVVSAKGMGYH